MNAPERSATEGDESILDLAGETVEDELEIKRQRVVRALGAQGVELEVPSPLPSPRRSGARARIGLRVADDGALVMFEPGSHVATDPPLDAMARPEIAAVARALPAALATAPRLLGALERVELRSDGQRVVAVFAGAVPRKANAELARALEPALGEDGAVALGGRAILGNARLRIDIGPLELEVGPLSFYQVNLEANRRLVASVVEAVMGFDPARVLDLFGGAGNLSLPLAAAGVAVGLVESHPSAVKDARANAARLGLDLSCTQQDAYRLSPGDHFFDVAVLDPPRAGARGAMAAVCATRPRGIVLVSCHPASLARDLSQAMAQGYEPTRLELHDLFPLTSHVESLVVLTRR